MMRTSANVAVRKGAPNRFAAPPSTVSHSRFVQGAFALVLLIVLAAPAAVAALLLLASLGRPLLFRQARSGLEGRSFTIVKLRTMRELFDVDGRALPDEARQTLLSRFIRAIRLDETPQLFAILVGDMDFVGPRPLFAETIASFGPAGKLRGAVRPGLTGWAQVNGNTRLTPSEKLALDIWYVDHRSVWLDLKILALTAMVVVRGERVNSARVIEALRHFATRMSRTTP